MMTLYQNPTFTRANEIFQLCRPLRDLKIDYFSHMKVDHNNNFSFICSNPQFIDVYFKKKYFNIDINTAVDDFGRYVIWDNLPRTGKTLELEKDAISLGVNHTFTIIEKNKHYVDFFHFSSSVETKAINQTYLTFLHVLNGFVYDFKKIIKEDRTLGIAYDQQFKVDHDATGFEIDSSGIVIPKRNIQLCHSLPKLTSREEEYLRLCVRGKTAREIAEELYISYRTVEKHLESAKTKFHVNTKSKLIDAWLNLNPLT